VEEQSGLEELEELEVLPAAKRPRRSPQEAETVPAALMGLLGQLNSKMDALSKAQATGAAALASPVDGAMKIVADTVKSVLEQPDEGLRSGFVLMLKAMTALDAADPTRLQHGRISLLKVAYDLLSANAELKDSQVVSQAFATAESLTGLLQKGAEARAVRDSPQQREVAPPGAALVPGRNGRAFSVKCHQCTAWGHYANQCPRQQGYSRPSGGYRPQGFGGMAPSGSTMGAGQGPGPSYPMLPAPSGTN